MSPSRSADSPTGASAEISALQLGGERRRQMGKEGGRKGGAGGRTWGCGSEEEERMEAGNCKREVDEVG